MYLCFKILSEAENLLVLRVCVFFSFHLCRSNSKLYMVGTLFHTFLIFPVVFLNTQNFNTKNR